MLVYTTDFFFFFLAVFTSPDKGSALPCLNLSRVRGLHELSGSSSADKVMKGGTVTRFCPSASFRGRLVAIFICWLTLCAVMALKKGITVTWTPFTWRKSHSVCSTPAAPLPHLQLGTQSLRCSLKILVVCPSSTRCHFLYGYHIWKSSCAISWCVSLMALRRWDNTGQQMSKWTFRLAIECNNRATPPSL